jgi:glucuronoarabinoxylan endo-1,4-beta-xylanase
MLTSMQQRTLVVLKTNAWLVLLSFSLAAQAQTGPPTATVNWTDVHQTMDGFGGQTWNYANTLTSAQADLFFSPTAGIGMAYVRTANTFNGSIPDLVTLQAAVARGALVELSLQSPPCTLKHSSVELSEACTNPSNTGSAFRDGSTSSNGTCFTSSRSLATSYTSYATYIVNYINTLQNSPNNIPIAVLDVQNEPNASPSSLGACLWGSGSNFDTFVGTYLGPALATAGLHPKVMLGSAFNWFGSDFSTACLNNATCAQYVSIAAGHGYGYPFTPSAYSLGTSSGRHLWMSETANQSGTYDGTIADGLTLAKNINDFLTVANVSGYEYWELAYNTAGSCPNCGLTDPSFNPSKRFYAEGNWSKFIRPGWVRIGATANPVGGVYVSAYKDPSSGNFAIVAINENGTDAPLDFVLNGFTGSSVTPWVTSASLDLAQQTSISAGGGAFSGTLLASSVTTFVSKLSSTPVAPPTNLNAIVH